MLERLVNGDPASPVGLTEAGREQARELGAASRERGRPRRAHRVRADARDRRAGLARRRRCSCFPELNEYGFGASRAARPKAIGSGLWRRRARFDHVPAAARAALRSRHALRRGYRALLERPEERDRGRRPRRSGALPPATRSTGKPPRRRLDGVDQARPFPFDVDSVERARRGARSVGRGARLVGHTEAMLQRIESFIREHGLIEPGGEVTCLVSGGADSTCLWHALGALGYRVSALHVAPRPARRRVGRGRALLPRGVRRRGRRLCF